MRTICKGNAVCGRWDCSLKSDSYPLNWTLVWACSCVEVSSQIWDPAPVFTFKYQNEHYVDIAISCRGIQPVELCGDAHRALSRNHKRLNELSLLITTTSHHFDRCVINVETMHLHLQAKKCGTISLHTVWRVTKTSAHGRHRLRWAANFWASIFHKT